MGERESDDDADEVSCFSREGFLFLFPPKSGWLEVLIAAVTVYLYGASMTFMFHPETMALCFGY